MSKLDCPGMIDHKACLGHSVRVYSLCVCRVKVKGVASTSRTAEGNPATDDG